MMQSHPIDLIREQLSRAAFRFGQGLMGVATALALVGLMWVGSLRPADAAGQRPAATVTALAWADGHLGAAAPTRVVASASASGVCRLVFDPDAAAPLSARCPAGGVRGSVPVLLAD